MNFRKITLGYVVQTFDEYGECLGQYFEKGDEVEYEKEDDDSKITDIYSEDMPFGGNEYFHFDMIQP